MTQDERQAIVDEEHLRLLDIAYWIMGGFTAIYSLFIVAYFGVLGVIFLWSSGGSDAPPEFVGWLFLGIGAFVILFCAAFAGYEIAVGFWIRQRRHRVATIVLGAVFCPSLPFGTALGVSTLMVMLRPSVKSLYDPVRKIDGEPPVPPAVQLESGDTAT